MSGELRTSSTPPKTKIFVGNLPEEAHPQDLRRLFEEFGVVTECDILNRYGFVHMKTEGMAARAIRELNNADFMGVQISVEQSTGKRGGRGGGGGGGGRGGFGPVRGYGGMRRFGGRAPPPYMRDDRDFDRRPDMFPPSSVRNGYSFDRGYDGYPPRGPPFLPSRDRGPERRPYPDMPRPFERRSFSDVRSPYDRPSLPPVSAYDRRSDYGGSRMSAGMFRRRSP